MICPSHIALQALVDQVCAVERDRSITVEETSRTGPGSKPPLSAVSGGLLDACICP